jgi:hypothetical protein
MSIAYFTVPNDQHQVTNIAAAMDSRDLDDHDIINIETVNANTLVKVWFRQVKMVPSGVKVAEIDVSKAMASNMITNAGQLVAAFGAPQTRYEPPPNPDAHPETSYDPAGWTPGVKYEKGDKVTLNGEVKVIGNSGTSADLDPKPTVPATDVNQAKSKIALKSLPNSKHRR